MKKKMFYVNKCMYIKHINTKFCVVMEQTIVGWEFSFFLFGKSVQWQAVFQFLSPSISQFTSIALFLDD